ncbi:MAG: sodium:proton antiporter, partial [Oscillospiraceae bacterium]|nr:sodium:proton antiporter [Oscillospiraceae bacterium]
MLVLMVSLPMIAALVCYPICRNSERAWFTPAIVVSGAVFVMGLLLVGNPELAEGVETFCGNGIYFKAGGLRTVMATLAGFMWVMTALASPEYFSGARANGRYFLFYLWTLGALEGVFLAADLMTLFVFFEIMSFTSYVWVVQNETPEAIRASETYLFIAVIGGLTMLMGLFLLDNAIDGLSFENILEKAPGLSPRLRYTVGVCALVGFGAKAGMFPLHIWLPKAHPVAPAPASALLSGILTKSGVFGVIGISCWLFDSVPGWGNLLLVPAVITMFLGAVLAVFSVDLKRTLACSSMSQIGFILTGVSMCVMLGEHGSIAACGAVLHILNHSLIKLTLFVAAGVVYFNVHSLDLNDVRGFGKDKPLLKLAFLSGACSIAGIPGFGGYISKTLLHEGIVEYCEHLSEHGLSAAPYRAVEWIFLLSGGLTLAYMTRLFYIIFVAEKPEHQHQKEKYMSPATALVLAIGGVLMPLLGLTAHQTMDRIAAYALPFFRREPMSHAVNYFSLGNLK